MRGRGGARRSTGVPTGVTLVPSTPTSGRGRPGRRRAGGYRDGDQRLAFARELTAELERARRHEHPLTIARIEVTADVLDPERTGVVPALPTRRIDATFLIDDVLLLLAPETGPEGFAALAARLRVRLEHSEPQIQGVCFPEDGLSSDALISRLFDPNRLPRIGHELPSQDTVRAAGSRDPGTARTDQPDVADRATSAG